MKKRHHCGEVYTTKPWADGWLPTGSELSGFPKPGLVLSASLADGMPIGSPRDRRIVVFISHARDRTRDPLFGVPFGNNEDGNSLDGGYILSGSPFGFNSCVFGQSRGNLNSKLSQVEHEFKSMMDDRPDSVGVGERGQVVAVDWTPQTTGIGVVISSARLDYDHVPVFMTFPYEFSDDEDPLVDVVRRDEIVGLKPHHRTPLFPEKMSISLLHVRTIARNRLSCPRGRCDLAVIGSLGSRFESTLDRFSDLLFAPPA